MCALSSPSSQASQVFQRLHLLLHQGLWPLHCPNGLLGKPPLLLLLLAWAPLQGLLRKPPWVTAHQATAVTLTQMLRKVHLPGRNQVCLLEEESLEQGWRREKIMQLCYLETHGLIFLFKCIWVGHTHTHPCMWDSALYGTFRAFLGLGDLMGLYPKGLLLPQCLLSLSDLWSAPPPYNMS